MKKDANTFSYRSCSTDFAVLRTSVSKKGDIESCLAFAFLMFLSSVHGRNSEQRHLNKCRCYSVLLEI